MSELAVQFLDQNLHRVLFDAMPMPVFVVDEDVSLLEYNTAAAQLIGANKQVILHHRGGEVLHCIHATEHPEGCGRSKACTRCVVRKAVGAAFKGQEIRREPAQLELRQGTKKRRVNLQVSCRSVDYEGHAFALLILEGLS
jgi:PAS domain-containing protein